jgi:hypothetical protein
MNTTTIPTCIPPEEPSKFATGAAISNEKSDISSVESNRKLQDVFAAFKAVVKSEEDAANILYTVMKEEGLTCPCGAKNLEHISGTRKFVCLHCEKFAYFTAGTIFHGVSRLSAWTGSLVILSLGIPVTIHKLARLFDIAPATAYNMHKSVAYATGTTSKCDKTARLVSGLVETILHRQEQQALNNSTENLTATQYRVWAACSEDRSSIDQLIVDTKLPTGSVLSALTELEMINLLEPLSANWYRRRQLT